MHELSQKLTRTHAVIEYLYHVYTHGQFLLTPTQLPADAFVFTEITNIFAIILLSISSPRSCVFECTRAPVHSQTHAKITHGHTHARAHAHTHSLVQNFGCSHLRPDARGWWPLRAGLRRRQSLLRVRCYGNLVPAQLRVALQRRCVQRYWGRRVLRRPAHREHHDRV
jgi:hypothetical protein